MINVQLTYLPADVQGISSCNSAGKEGRIIEQQRSFTGNINTVVPCPDAVTHLKLLLSGKAKVGVYQYALMFYVD